MIRDDKREVELKVEKRPKFEFDIKAKFYIRCQENSLRCRWLIRVDKRLVGGWKTEEGNSKKRRGLNQTTPSQMKLLLTVVQIIHVVCITIFLF